MKRANHNAARRATWIRTFLLGCLLVIGSSPFYFGESSIQDRRSSDKKRAAVKANPLLWREPADIETRNLLTGPGGDSMKPSLEKITFVREKKGGYSTKYEVVDGSGKKWIVKVGKEAQSETAADRLLWAVGYFTEISCLVPQVTIAPLGTLSNARFEARPNEVERLGEWKWADNPFMATSQLQGLKIMMVLINNWDIKDSNNDILRLRNDATGEEELRYIISDLGGTFGKTGSILTRSRNAPDDYVTAKFINNVKEGFVDFHYSGKRKGVFDDITPDQARWIARWLSRLNSNQIRDAFRAANYTPEEVDALAAAVETRIQALIELKPRIEKSE